MFSKYCSTSLHWINFGLTKCLYRKLDKYFNQWLFKTFMYIAIYIENTFYKYNVCVGLVVKLIFFWFCGRLIDPTRWWILFSFHRNKDKFKLPVTTTSNLLWFFFNSHVQFWVWVHTTWTDLFNYTALFTFAFTAFRW